MLDGDSVFASLPPKGGHVHISTKVLSGTKVAIATG